MTANDRTADVRRIPRPRPIVVALCGSTRFRREYAEAFYDEEHSGRICLTVPCYKSDPCCKTPEDHARLDRLHLAKIDMADEILVINPGNYIGSSTRNEIEYARAAGKRVRFLELPTVVVLPEWRPPAWAEGAHASTDEGIEAIDEETA